MAVLPSLFTKFYHAALGTALLLAGVLIAFAKDGIRNAGATAILAQAGVDTTPKNSLCYLSS